ncbi:MAG: hypothetical protein GXY77_01065 [Fibrobacter sp.]|nr:hypothetical protein [Fibrobacter sp.]
MVPCYTNLPESTNNYSEYLNVVCDPSKNGWHLPSEAESNKPGLTRDIMNHAQSGLERSW